MDQQFAFLPEHQFHVLLKIDETEHPVTVLPDEKGKFLIVDQGQVLGQVDFDRQFNCIAARGAVDVAILAQLNRHIKDHYEYTGLYR